MLMLVLPLLKVAASSGHQPLLQFSFTEETEGSVCLFLWQKMVWHGLRGSGSTETHFTFPFFCSWTLMHPLIHLWYFKLSRLNVTCTLQLINKDSVFFFFYIPASPLSSRSCVSTVLTLKYQMCGITSLWKCNASRLCSDYTTAEAALWVMTVAGLKQGTVLWYHYCLLLWISYYNKWSMRCPAAQRTMMKNVH